MMGHYDSIDQVNLLLYNKQRYTDYQILVVDKNNNISFSRLLIAITNLINLLYYNNIFHLIKTIQNPEKFIFLLGNLIPSHKKKEVPRQSQIIYLINTIFYHKILPSIVDGSYLVNYIMKTMNFLSGIGDDMSQNNDFNYLIKYGKLPENITDKGFKSLLDKKDYIRNNILHYILYDVDISLLNKTLDFIIAQPNGFKKLSNMLSSSNIGGNTPLSLLTHENNLIAVLQKIDQIELGSVYNIKDKYGQNLLHFIAKSGDMKAKALFKIITSCSGYEVNFLTSKLLQSDNFGYSVIRRLKSQGNYETLNYLKKALPKTVISQIALLSNNEQTKIAKVVIRNKSYNILCKKERGSNKVEIADSSITIKKEDWSDVNNQKLKSVLDRIEITGTKDIIKLAYNNQGLSLKCDMGNYYAKNFYSCSDIKRPLSILDAVQGLGNTEGSIIEIAEVNINGLLYKIACKQGNIEYKIFNKSIIISNTNWTNITDKGLKDIISSFPLSGTKDTLKVLENYDGNIKVLGYIKDYNFNETIKKMHLPSLTKSLSILDGIQNLDNKSVASKKIAVVDVSGENYQIVCKPGNQSHRIIGKSVIIENNNWKKINKLSLQRIIESIHFTGVKSNPKIAANNEGVQLNCDLSGPDRKLFILCDNIDRPLSVLDEVQTLYDDIQHSSRKIAKVKIGANEYNIICEKGDNDSVQIQNQTIKLINNWNNITNEQLQKKITDIRLTNTRKSPIIAEDQYGIKVFKFNKYYNFSQTTKIANLINSNAPFSILDKLQSLNNMYGQSQNIARVKIKNKDYYITCVQGNGVTKINNYFIVLESLNWNHVTNKSLQNRISEIKLKDVNDNFVLSKSNYSIQLDCSSINFGRITTINNCFKNVFGGIAEKVKYLSNYEIEQIADIVIDGRIYNIIYELNQNSSIYGTIIDNAIAIRGKEANNEEKLSDTVNKFSVMKRGYKYFLRYNRKQKSNIYFSLPIGCSPQVFSKKSIQKCIPDINFVSTSYLLFLIKSYNKMGRLSERILEIIEKETLQIVNIQQEINDTKTLLLMTELKLELNNYLSRQYDSLKRDCLEKVNCNGFFSRKTINTLTPKTNTWLNWQSILKVKLPFENEKERRLTFYQSAKTNENIAIKNFIIGANLKEMTDNTLTFSSASSVKIEKDYFYSSNILTDLQPIIHPQPLLRLASHVCKNIEWIDHVQHNTKDDFLFYYHSLFSIKGGNFQCKSSNIWLNKEKYDFINTLNFIMNLENFFKFLKQEEEVIPGVFFGAYNCHMHNECQDFVQEILQVADDNLYGYDFGSPHDGLDFIDF